MALIAMNCKYVTDERVREWKSASSAVKLDEHVSMDRFIYELCWIIARGELPLNKCRLALEAGEFSDADDVSSSFADTIAHMSLELSVPGELRSRLVELAKWLVEAGLVPVRHFQERCEAEFLWEAEMIKIKAQDLKAKEVRVNTRLLYQQTKFNLLREESEGYAKLLTLLSQNGSDSSTLKSSSAVISSIKSLIGHYDLDPNRVFDTVLEFFELYPENPLFLSLIPLFPKSHLCHILGFKFQYYQRPEVDASVPAGLYRLAATLIKEKFLELDNLYIHLLPKDDEAFEQYNDILKRRMDEANKIGKINLAATGRDLEEEKPGDVTIELYAALDAEADANAERSMELVRNQKLGLLNGFLDVEDWHHAHILFERLHSLNPVAHEPILVGLLRLIETNTAPLYSRLKPEYLSKLTNQDRKILVTDVRKELFQMLSWAGPYLYRDVILLQKVCKVLREYYLSAQSAVSSTRSQEVEHKNARATLKDARLKVEEALGSCLLPSLQLLPANPAICIAIWEVMSLLPYEVRYRLYGEWEKDDETLPVLVAARQTAKLDTRRILKRLAKENLKQLGRMVAKVAHANPLTVLRTIVHQIEAYKDMIPPVVDAFKYLTQLEYDVLEYVVLERLAQGGREKLKEDGLNLSDWLQSLASFWGHLCKKYPSMELRGLFQYIVNQLKRGEGIELVVLQELMQQMANIEYTENVTEDQLEAMSGGETLRYQATALGRNNKAFAKSTNRLRDALFSKDEPKLALPMLLLIAQHRSNIINNANAPHIKMVSEQFDRCHGTLLQYVEFLNVAVSTYAQHAPTLEDLIHKYHIEPEVAFLIYRPVLAHFRPVKGTESSEKVENESAAGQNSKELVLDLGSHRKAMTWSELLGVVHAILPLKAWNSLSPELYLTFWGLSLHDLYVPRKRYELEMAKQRSALKALEESSDNTSAAIAKRKKDKEKIQETLDRLSSELQKQEQSVAAVHQRLLRDKDSWLATCPDSFKINMELFQRCIFPRCVFSMIDAVYCAKFVQTLHSLGTPFFNTVNHIDTLICKLLQPMISCCTEYEAGRLGRFLLETLKMAYHWKSDESIYDRECANMPGFGTVYKDPNSKKVSFAQYVKIHWKWSSRLTKLLAQCLESSEHMEIRNALTVLTKISGVFPVTKKTGLSLERRVNKIKLDDREDLKVLATGVSAALASRKSSWVTDEVFGMGYIEIKQPAHVPPKPSASASGAEPSTRPDATETPRASEVKPSASASRPAVRTLSPADSKQVGQAKNRKPASEPAANGVDARVGSSKDEVVAGHPKASLDEERSQPRKPVQSSVSAKTAKLESPRDEQIKLTKSDAAGKEVAGLDSKRATTSHAGTSVTNTRAAPVSSSQKARTETNARNTETKPNTERDKDAHEGGTSNHTSRSPSHREDGVHSNDKDRQGKRAGSNDESERGSKRRKADSNVEAGEIRTGERWVNSSDRPRSAEHVGYEDRLTRERTERDAHRIERNVDRTDRDRQEEYITRDRPVEKLSRDRSIDKNPDRAADWNFDRISERNRDDRNKDERNSRLRHNDLAGESSHVDERFSQSLPPPPPLPPNVVPHSISAASSRRDEEGERRRAVQRLSPPHRDRDDKRRVEETSPVLLEDAKRRRDEDTRERKREEREMLVMKAAEKERERDREREKMKEEAEGASSLSKRRKLKRDHLSGAEGFLPPPPPLPSVAASQPYSERERKAIAPPQRNIYMEQQMYPKEVPSKMARREQEQMYERDWEEEKRQQRADLKRRHHRK